MSKKRPDSPSWTAAKAHGDGAELAVAEYFKSRDCDVAKTLGNDTYDLLIMMKVEVKNDLKAVETGNAAFEVAYKGKPSGVMATSARRYALVVGDTVYMARTAQLRALLQSGNFQPRPAGDGKLARVSLIPLGMLSELDFVQTLILPESVH